jgi:fructose-1,6-bisphosphatase/inositol monophosphatase family enzyme
MAEESPPSVLPGAGLTPEALARIEHMLVGCGGFVRELIAHTGRASTVKDAAGQRLSAADTLVDELLRRHLLELVPDSGGYSEEGGWFGHRQAPRVRWLVDPVDGTRPAILGGAFGVCVAALVMERGAPAAACGWVYVPTLATLYRGVVTSAACECLANGRPARAAPQPGDELRNRYLGVSSNWQTTWLAHSSMKVSGLGATSIHLTQLVQPESDVAAVALTRYQAHDAAAGLAVAVAGGCAIYALEGPEGRPGHLLEPLAFLQAAHDAPERRGEHVLVCLPAVAEALRPAAPA